MSTVMNGTLDVLPHVVEAILNHVSSQASGKSGVGGGILAVAPGKASIAVWSPGLDASGNSHLGRIALEKLARKMQWSIFGQ